MNILAKVSSVAALRRSPASLLSLASSSKKSCEHDQPLRLPYSRRTLARMLADPENKGSQQRHVNFDTLGTW